GRFMRTSLVTTKMNFVPSSVPAITFAGAHGQTVLLVEQPFHSRGLTVCGLQGFHDTVATKLQRVFVRLSLIGLWTIKIGDLQVVLAAFATDCKVRSFRTIPATQPLIGNRLLLALRFDRGARRRFGGCGCLFVIIATGTQEQRAGCNEN